MKIQWQNVNIRYEIKRNKKIKERRTFRCCRRCCWWWWFVEATTISYSNGISQRHPSPKRINEHKRAKKKRLFNENNSTGTTKIHDDKKKKIMKICLNIREQSSGNF